MHLAVFAEKLPVGVDDHGGVMIESRRAPLEERSDDDDAPRGGQLLQGLRAGTRNRFGQAKMGVILRLAKIERTEELLRGNDLRALVGRLLDAGQDFRQIFLGIRAASHLYQGDPDLIRCFHKSDVTTQRPCGGSNNYQFSKELNRKGIESQRPQRAQRQSIGL